MKNISNILIGILFAAVAVLYFLYFSGKSQKTEAPQAGSTMVASLNELGIAYVNSDSLLKNYEYFNEMQEKLTAKRDKLNKEYQNRAQGLQQEITNFQRNASNMTISQAQAVQDDLKRKQQNLMMYQDQLSQQLMKEENQMNNELYDKVADYLKRYGEKNNLKLVLTYAKGSGVLFADDTLDITDQIIAGLNEEYHNEKSGKNKNKKASVKADTATSK